MRERFWNKHDFETALNLEVSNETYSQIEFCYLVLEHLFPDMQSVISYYWLNGEDGFLKLYPIASTLHELQNYADTALSST